MNLIKEAEALVKNLDQRMSPSIYDTTWLMRLRTEDGNPRWPELGEWLLDRQHGDGSWGAGIRYYHHDRIICTLSAIIGLMELGPTPANQTAIERGQQFIWQNAHLMHRDPALVEPVGFELIFPTLMEEARQAGMSLPGHAYGLGSMKYEKLRLIPPDMLLSKDLTTVHSLEFLGPEVGAENLHQAIFENGSLGNSPATTAYYLRTCQRQNVTPAPGPDDYLARVKRDGEAPIYLYPFRNFEALWVLNNLRLVVPDLFQKSWFPEDLLDDLEIDIASGGVSLDREFGINDADCTSVAYCMLQLAGRDIDPSALLNFEVPGEGFFRTYFFERNPSISTNIHALEALREMPSYPNRAEIMDSIESMLLQARQFNLFWTDKWHASPYYATSYALIALLDGDSACRKACLYSLDWISRTQRANGSWGFFSDGTPEETAYALLAMQHAHRYRLVDEDALKRGADYLLAYGQVENRAAVYDEMWLGKCLYAPEDIVRSAVLAALINHEQIFGRQG